MLGPESVGPAIRALGAWAPIGFGLIYAFRTVLFFPDSILSLVGGAVFGAVRGTAWKETGATLGATTAFILPHTVAGVSVARRASGRLA